MKKLLFIISVIASFNSSLFGSTTRHVQTNNKDVFCTVETFSPVETYQLLGIDRLKNMFSTSDIPNTLLNAEKMLMAAKVTIKNKSATNIKISRRNFLKIGDQEDFFIPNEHILNLYPETTRKQIILAIKIFLGTAAAMGGLHIASKVARKHSLREQKQFLNKINNESKKSPLTGIFFCFFLFPIILPMYFIHELARLAIYSGIGTIPALLLYIWGTLDFYKLLRMSIIKNKISNPTKNTFASHYIIPSQTIFEGFVFFDLTKVTPHAIENNPLELICHETASK
jgi:hypothetical protein